MHDRKRKGRPPRSLPPTAGLRGPSMGGGAVVALGPLHVACGAGPRDVGGVRRLRADPHAPISTEATRAFLLVAPMAGLPPPGRVPWGAPECPPTSGGLAHASLASGLSPRRLEAVYAVRERDEPWGRALIEQANQGRRGAASGRGRGEGLRTSWLPGGPWGLGRDSVEASRAAPRHRARLSGPCRFHEPVGRHRTRSRAGGTLLERTDGPTNGTTYRYRDLEVGRLRARSGVVCSVDPE
jgi:hypothetical protein